MQNGYRAEQYYDDEEQPAGFPRCGAKTRDGDPCKNAQMANGRCRMHGGRSLAGIASPTYAGKGRSKYLPRRLVDRYDQVLQEDLLPIQDDLALYETRLTELLQRLEVEGDRPAESGDLWLRLRSAWQDYKRAADDGERVAALFAVGQLIQEGATVEETWAEIQNLTLQRSKLVDVERKRIYAAETTVTLDQFRLVMTLILEAVRRNVYDQRVLQAIGEEADRLFHLAQTGQTKQLNRGRR